MFFKQKTAYEMRISDWSSDVCSSDLLGLAIARDLERLVHDVGAVVPDRARRQFDAVADDVILPREDVERVLGLQRFELALRHRKRVVTEVDLAGVLVGLEHREIDDPTHGEPVRVDQVELLGDAGARPSRELDRKSTRLNYS